MIFSTTEPIQEGFQRAVGKKDQLVFEHIQRIGPILEDAHVSRESGREGWTPDRSMQLIATIPANVFVQHPEFVHDTSLVVKWLKTDEGAPYRTTKGRI